jgi:molybdopterin-guanine dinucleotide biosynthesis protein A
MGFLVRSLGEHQAVVPMWPNGYLESLHSVLERDSALKAAGEAIDSGDLSVRGLFDRLSDVEFMDVELLREYDPELLTFFNVNTWEDLKKARRIAGDERDYQDG